ncbi:hypothetical protein X975_06943, partial [Stegodyphus mimosarum]
ISTPDVFGNFGIVKCYGKKAIFKSSDAKVPFRVIEDRITASSYGNESKRLMNFDRQCSNIESVDSTSEWQA